MLEASIFFAGVFVGYVLFNPGRRAKFLKQVATTIDEIKQDKNETTQTPIQRP
jgi:hypothetical protein